MKETEYKITKDTVEVYKIRSNTSYWADITIDENKNSGRIQIASDFGNWQNYWGACGESFKEFLSNLDIYYFAGKVGADKWFDLDKTIQSLKDLIEECAEDEDHKKELLNELSELKDCHGKYHFISEVENCSSIMEFTDNVPGLIYSIEPGFKKFLKEIWAVFIKEISKQE